MLLLRTISFVRIEIGANPNRMYFKCQRNCCKFFQWEDNIPSGKNMAWLGRKVHVGSRLLTTTQTRKPLLSVTGEDPVWNEVLATPITVEDSTNRIVAPPELKDFYTCRGFHEELLHYLYIYCTFTECPG